MKFTTYSIVVVDGPEMTGHEEGPSGTPEELSEQAKQRFAGAAAALQQIQREEKKSKRRDSSVAQTIAQLLTDKQRQHLSVLIARITARNCPSAFILAIISLINEECLKRIQEYLKESGMKSAHETVDESIALTKNNKLDAASNRAMIDWITRLQLVLSLDAEDVLASLLLDEKNMDGTVLQLTAFVIQDFFKEHKISASYERVQPLTASILQTVFQPYLGIKKKTLERAREKEKTVDG